MWYYIVLFFNRLSRLFNKIFIASVKKKAFLKSGKKVSLGKHITVFGYKKVSVGDYSSIGDGALFMCTRAEIKIGDHVMLAPNVTIITGDHRIDIKGKYMSDIRDEDKLPENDAPVLIEGDNWIGANVTILKGVTIGRGSVIAAGSVVTKDIPQYSIAAGVPAKVIKNRFE